MNISGVVRIDLSGYVQNDYLLIGDVAVAQVWPLLGDGSGPFLLDIGGARHVTWDPRLVEMLLAADGVVVEGSSERGVREACLRLRQGQDERIPGPRSAS